MNEMEFSQKIDDLGGTLYIVGGWVRDKIRGVIPKDKDFVICHVKEEDFKQNFPKAKKVGKSFPVYLVKIEDKECEVAFARKERKTGIGYTGFIVDYDEKVTIEEDLYRRDTTMNSIAYRVRDGKIIDPYKGREDIEKDVLMQYHIILKKTL